MNGIVVEKISRINETKHVFKNNIYIYIFIYLFHKETTQKRNTRNIFKENLVQ